MSTSTAVSLGYAADISPQMAWEWMQSDKAVMVDVRSEAERVWVGLVPGAIHLAWMLWPGGTPNPEFDAGLQTLKEQQRKLLMLCRSGVRSIAAARRATELGFEAYNILEGFEGALDSEEHRGTTGGWRYRQLPWKQS